MDNYLQAANGSLMFILCALVVGSVAVLSVLFIKKSWDRGVELGIEPTAMKKVMTNSAVFSILPSLPIIIMMMVLSKPLGRFFAWVRLSVIGSASYESMAAGMVANSYGFDGIFDPGVNMTVFISCLWVMSFGIIWGIVFNIFFLKKLDNLSKKAKDKGPGFITVFTGALFVGMMSVFASTYITPDFRKFASDGVLKTLVPVICFIFSGVLTVLCGKIAKKTNIKVIDEFSMPISLVCGMAIAIIISRVFNLA